MNKVLMVLAFSFSGCGGCQRAVVAWTGSLQYKCSHAGVEYVQSDSGIAVSVDQTGKPIACK